MSYRGQYNTGDLNKQEVDRRGEVESFRSSYYSVPFRVKLYIVNCFRAVQRFQ